MVSPDSGTAAGVAAAGLRVGQPRRQPTAERRLSPAILNTNATQDVAVSLTKVAGRHTLKAGFYNGHELKSSNTQRGTTAFPGAPFGNLSFAQDTVGTNPFDTSFGFANAAIGSFSSFQQSTTFVETKAVYNNTEGYVQDNWRVNSRLTLDYGVRFVHQQPQHDTLGQASNFFPERWTLASAPLLYVAGLRERRATRARARTGRRMNPLTGQFLGAELVARDRHAGPRHGRSHERSDPAGAGHRSTRTYIWPTLAVAPRFGMAYDVTGTQRLILRGGGGLFFDRPNASTTTPRRRQSADVAKRHRSLRPAAEPWQRRA